jgi:hypothetical protein
LETWYVYHDTCPHLSGVLHNPSHQPVVARQQLGKNVTAATNTHNNRRIVGGVVFYADQVASKESGRLSLPELAIFPLLKKGPSSEELVIWRLIP